MDFPIFIASSIDYEPIHLTRLVNNIKCSNIPLQSVYIISGGHSREFTEKIEGVTIIRVPYRCFEFTPLLYIIKNVDAFNFKYAFFTHDTIEFGPSFYNKMKNIVLHMNEHNFETKRIDVGMSMNIGIYTKDIIIRNTDRLNALCLYTNNPSDLWNMKNRLVHEEDKILNSGKLYPSASIPILAPFRTTDTSGKAIVCYRKTYNDIDFIKYQTNHCKIVSINSPISIE